jgi:hypothetical protein
VCRLHFGQGLVVQCRLFLVCLSPSWLITYALFIVIEKSKPQEPEGTWEFSSSAEQAWERFDKDSVRQSQFTNSDRQSSFSYGLKSPLPPMPKLLKPSRFSG